MKSVVRYAVIGAGHIAQVAVLPAFRAARRNSRLALIISGDARKRRELGRRYEVPTYDYAACDAALASGEVDAVYIALPNDQHCEYAVRAARAGVHVLCEKPMAPTARECQRMLRVAETAKVQLMVAYRLHFEAATLAAMQIAQSGRLGELRIFDSTFSMQVKSPNIRIEQPGGGPLYDLGVYCIQAARLLFRANPVEVIARSVRGSGPRFRDVDEMTSAVLRFPGDQLASFTCSLGAADVSSYRIVGSRGDLRVEPAFEYAEGLAYELTIDGKKTRRRFAKTNQFAPELLHFSDRILRGRRPEPSGREGMVDVQIVEALLKSARSGRAVSLSQLRRHPRERWPAPRQARRLPSIRKPKLVRVESASR